MQNMSTNAYDNIYECYGDSRADAVARETLTVRVDAVKCSGWDYRDLTLTQRTNLAQLFLTAVMHLHTQGTYRKTSVQRQCNNHQYTRWRHTGSIRYTPV